MRKVLDALALEDDSDADEEMADIAELKPAKPEKEKKKRKSEAMDLDEAEREGSPSKKRKKNKEEKEHKKEKKEKKKAGLDVEGPVSSTSFPFGFETLMFIGCIGRGEEEIERRKEG